MKILDRTNTPIKMGGQYVIVLPENSAFNGLVCTVTHILPGNALGINIEGKGAGYHCCADMLEPYAQNINKLW